MYGLNKSVAMLSLEMENVHRLIAHAAALQEGRSVSIDNELDDHSIVKTAVESFADLVDSVTWSSLDKNRLERKGTEDEDPSIVKNVLENFAEMVDNATLSLDEQQRERTGTEDEMIPLLKRSSKKNMSYRTFYRRTRRIKKPVEENSIDMWGWNQHM